MATQFEVEIFVDRESRTVWNWQKHGWDVPEKYRVIEIWNGLILPSKKNVIESLLNLLQSSVFREENRRWDSIRIAGNGRSSSPEFLSILQATFGKSEWLWITKDMDDVAFCCLNSGLLLPGGIQRLNLQESAGRPMTRRKLSILSQGLAAAKCLKTLVLSIDFIGAGVGEHIIPGIQANASLKCIIAKGFSHEILSSLITALPGHPTMKSLRLACGNDLVFDDKIGEPLRAWLSRDDCKLEYLEFFREECSSSDAQSFTLNLDLPNISLEGLKLRGVNVDSSALNSILPKLKSLGCLELDHNRITDLQPFDCLLLGESCCLEHLDLKDNPISVASALAFAKKLPHMRVLRKLKLGNNPFLDNKDALEEFLEFVNKNTSLEQLEISMPGEEPHALRPRLMPGPCLNRACRRYLGNNPGSLPLHLIPYVIIRARKIRYYDPFEDARTIPLKELFEGHATFWLLRENDALLSHLS